MASPARIASLVALLGISTVAESATVWSRAAPKEGKTYDYVIVGGGLSGLVVANRLSEDETGMFCCGHCVNG